MKTILKYYIDKNNNFVIEPNLWARLTCKKFFIGLKYIKKLEEGKVKRQ